MTTLDTLNESPTPFEHAEELLAGQLGEVGRLQRLLSGSVADAAAFEDRRVAIWRCLSSIEAGVVAGERAAGL